MTYKDTVERWDVFEVAAEGRSDGNPFTDYGISGTFVGDHERVTVPGFYDGDGVYRVRFMPSFEGAYTFTISGTYADGDEVSGGFDVAPASAGNHGPVRVRGFHFEYEDGTPFYPVGTTAYVWELQNEELRERTLRTLSAGYFNKIRFCVFPKHYLYNLRDPISFPYEGTPCKFPREITGDFYRYMAVQPGNSWDFSRFNPAHFRNVERAIESLRELGIEADLICMHPYDRWGFSHMSRGEDALYLKYIVARFSAYRNVWWSLANEYDLLTDKTIADWESCAAVLVENDRYRHPRSIHNCLTLYDHTRPWITHCSIQRTDVYKCAEYVDEYRVRYGKPVVLDEIAYEGDLDQGWGNISGQELVRRFWEAAMRGGYASHGETYENPDGVLWWSHGGELRGQSQERLRFLRDILAQTPGPGLRRMDAAWDEVAATADVPGDSGYYIYYYGFMRPGKRNFSFDSSRTFRAEVIDTWNMTVESAGTHSGSFTLRLPGREYMAVRLTDTAAPGAAR